MESSGDPSSLLSEDARRELRVRLELALAAVLEVDDASLASFDRIEAAASGRDFFQTAEALGETLGAPLLGFLLLRELHLWSDRASQNVLVIAHRIRSAPPGIVADGDILRSVASTALLLWGRANDAGVASSGLASALLQVAADLAAHDRAEESAGTALGALALLSPSTAEFALGLDIALGHEDAVAPPERVAIRLRSLQRTLSEGMSVDAFDRALDVAAMIAALSETDAAPAVAAFVSMVGGVRELQLVAAAVMTLTHSGSGPPVMAARHALLPRWDLTIEELAQVLPASMRLAIDFEDIRLSLDPSLDDVMAETSWETFAFQHPAFVRSVPDQRSVLRADQSDELLMVVAHECAHVFTLLGQLGLALLALRAATVYDELTLAELSVEGLPDGLTDVAEIDARTVSALAIAEQTLELSAKARVLKSIWGPWFEGVAMFVELADDPTADAETRGPVFNVLMNLVDDAWLERLPDESAESFARRQGLAADERYRDALERAGARRLRGAYFDPALHRHRYVPGYLSVRAVVSSWRSTLGGEISGSAAARLLLHVTRFGTSEAVPDLSLPHDEFSAAAAERAIEWMRLIAKIDCSDIEAALGDHYGDDRHTLGGWRNGRYVRKDAPTADDLDWYPAKVRQASRTLCADRASTSRVADLGEGCAFVMRACADALNQREVDPLLLSDEYLNLVLERLLVMPIGSYSAPFWVDEARRRLIVVVRTREVGPTSDDTSYNVHSFTLEDSSFAALLAEMPGERRLTVTRLAILAAEGDWPIGRNVLAYSTGTWLHVEPRGLYTSTEGSPADQRCARARLAPTPLVRFESDVVASGKRGAQRTLSWLDRVEEWDTLGVDANVTPWVRRVRALAEEVIEPIDGLLARHGWTQVAAVVSPEVAATLGAHAFGHLQDRAGHYEAFLDLLDRSGRAPCDSAWMDGCAVDVHDALGGALFERDALGRWDVTQVRQHEEATA